MEYLLLIAFAVGLLLFVLSWLRVIFAGFGHHPLTGLVAAVPVLNLLVLPTIWHRVYGWVMIGFIGLLVAIGSWFAGADQRLYRYSADMGVHLPMVSEDGSLNPRQAANAGQSISIPSPTPNTTQPADPLPSGKEIPKTALYRMSYQPVAVGDLAQHQGHYIRITQQDRQTYEGKLLSVDADSLMVERRVNGGLVEHKVRFNEITATEAMTRE